MNFIQIKKGKIPAKWTCTAGVLSGGAQTR